MVVKGDEGEEIIKDEGKSNFKYIGLFLDCFVSVEGFFLF